MLTLKVDKDGVVLLKDILTPACLKKVKGGTVEFSEDDGCGCIIIILLDKKGKAITPELLND